MNPLLARIRSALAPEYEVHDFLGQGGMGVVVLATEVALRREVAIKVLRPELASARAAERFTREAQHLARVRHPNVVMIHQVGERAGLFFAVMERVEGETLEQRLARGPLTVTEARHLGLGLLSGLAAVHGAGLIHRDIKPGNIFLSGGEAMLADFGIARSIGESGSSSAGTAGTPEYMAPEQRANLPLTPGTDLHAVGAVLYEATTGRCWSLEREPIRWQGVPRRFRWVVSKALEPATERRWQDAREFREALAAPLPRVPGLRAGVGVLGMAAVVTAVIIIFRPRPEAPPEPRVQLTVLPFQGPDSLGAQRVARYLGSQLESFNRWVPVRPVSVSLRVQPPKRAKLPAWWNSHYLVSGEIGLDGELVIEVRRGDDDERLTDRFVIPGPYDPLAQANTAAHRLIARLFPAHYPRFVAITGKGGSQSPRAVDAFIAGKDAFHHGSYDSAETLFRRALADDPDFSFAAWHLAITDRWRRTLRQEELQALGRRHIPRLAQPYGDLLAAQLEPALDRRLKRLREIVAADSANGDAQLLYADELFHRGPVIGIPLDSAIAAFQNAIRVDPYLDAAPALDHVVWAGILLGDREGAREALDGRQEIAARLGERALSEGKLRTRFLEFAYDERFVPWRGRLKRIFFLRPSEPRLAGISRYVRLGLSFDIPATEVMLGEVLVRRGHNDSLRAQGYMAQGLGLMALGRPTEAILRFDSAAARFRSVEAQLQRAQWRLLPAVLGLPPASPSHTSLGKLLLSGLVGTAAEAGARWTLLVAEASLAGRVDSVEFARLRAAADDDPSLRPLVTLLEALLLARTAGPAVALARTDTLVRSGSLAASHAPFARALLQLSRADWQAALGERDAALRSLTWYQNTDIEGWAQGEAQAGDVDGVLGVLARLRSGALLLELDRRDAGCALLSRVRELWAKAEPSFAQLRAHADSLHERCTT